MKLRTVDYYDEFHCLAGYCPATCCAGWRIPLDAAAQETARENGVTVHRGFLQGTDNRCPFLEADGLCRLIREAGNQDTVSYVCRTYPRKIADYGALRTVSLSLSCPEAARLFLAHKDGLRFTERMIDEPPALNDIDAGLFRRLEKLRVDAIAAAQVEAMPLRERILYVMELLGAPLKSLSAKTRRKRLFRLIRRLDFMDRTWKKELLSHRNMPETAHVTFEDAFPSLLVYFLDRYLLEAAEDGDAASRGKLCIVMLWMLWEMSADVSTEAAFIDLLVRFSREIEHSDGNLHLLMKRAKRVLPS